MSHTTSPLTPEVTWATGHWSPLCSTTCSSLWRSGSALWPARRSEFKVHSATRVTYGHSAFICRGSLRDRWGEGDQSVPFPRVMDSFTVNDRAKLVIIEQSAQWKTFLVTLLCMIPYALPDCGRVCTWQHFNQLWNNISLTCRSLTVTWAEMKHRFN